MTTQKKTPIVPNHADRLPVLFVGHGNPMNALEDNQYVRAWQAQGRLLPRPKAILCISAHWFVRGTSVHVADRPQTLYDFYGFPAELYEQHYDCPGSPELARRVQRLIKHAQVGADLDWGVDHGTWVPLKRMFPKADVPVVQLSLDYSKPARFHYDLAKELAPLRREGILIIGSGNVPHNLGRFEPERDAEPYPWAVEFDETLKKLIQTRDHESLINYEKLGYAAKLSIPTPDHYLPLLYALALQESDEQVEFFAEGIAHGSISMRSLKIS
jgi:4,5-DOPA dioxygenase extradiol